MLAGILRTGGFCRGCRNALCDGRWHIWMVTGHLTDKPTHDQSTRG